MKNVTKRTLWQNLVCTLPAAVWLSAYVTTHEGHDTVVTRTSRPTGKSYASYRILIYEKRVSASSEKMPIAPSMATELVFRNEFFN